ncbi:MAG: hypothetical protein RIB58_03420 [Phycisphaerales bacterium]
MNNTARACLTLLAAVGMAVATTSASAQDRAEPRPDRAERQRGQDRPMLAGPQVRDQRLPGVESGFTMDRGEQGRMAGQPVPPQAFRRAMASLMAEDAPLEIRLSPEQRERIMAHVQAFEEQSQRFRGQQDQARGQRARPEGERGRGEDRRPDADRQRPQRFDPPMPQGERRERRLDPENAPRQGGPEGQTPRGERGQDAPRRPGAERGPNRGPQQGGMDPQRARQGMMRAMADLQHRVWSELSASQQAHVSKALDEYRAQADEQRMGQMRERYRREIGQRFEEMEGQRPQRRPERRAEGSQDAPSTADAQELRRWFESLPEDVRRRVQERVSSMPEERRQALIERAASMSPDERARLVRRILQSERPDSTRRPPQ